MGLRSRFKKTKTLTGACTYRPWNQWKVGDLFIGTYEEEAENKFDASKPNYKFNVLETSFGVKENTSMVLNHNGALAKAISKLNPNEVVQITYNGMGTMGAGKFEGKDAHSLDIAVGLIGDESEEVEL